MIERKIIIKSIQEPYMVYREWMDDYINNIERRVLQSKLPPEDMKIVKRYRECNLNKRFEKIDFKKLMSQLLE